jgi:hypothetical protein
MRAEVAGLRSLLGAVLLVTCSPLARATDWVLSVDGRLLSSDAAHPVMDGGFGTTRFGSNDDGLQLGRARFALTQPIGDVWSLHLDASMFDNLDRHPVGVTEAFVLFRPYPFGAYRLRLKAGGFYPPVSLENRASGWESPYTLSYSALNSWLASEVRTVGLEGQLDWLGRHAGHTFDVSVTGGVFGWNDGAGVVVANTGFLLSDRQTPLFGRVGQPGVPPLKAAEPFLELDHRAGVYGGVEVRYLDRLILRALRYDNRADPTQVDAVSNVIAWETRFNSVGVRLETGQGWTAIAQWLDGDTTIAPQGNTLEWPFRAGFALVARSFGRHTLSARYDRFEVESNVPVGYGSQDGHAWTAAWLFDVDAHWRVGLEWLQVVSSSTNRQQFGGPLLATETQLQLSVRYALGSGVR